MKKITIVDAIVKTLQESKSSLTIGEIAKQIIDKKYYEFKSTNPAGIISSQIRRHLQDSMTSKNQKIIFTKIDNRISLK